MRVNSKPNHLTAKKLITLLATRGRYSFTSDEARTALQVSPNASKLALNKLAKQGLVASPARGFYVIIPPEYHNLGCLPAEQFIPALMKEKGLSYYAGLLSAAQYYGAAHQRPQEFQVFVAKNRRPIRCGKVRVKFIARKKIDDVPVQFFNTERGELRVSTAEATAFDLMGYHQHAGGLDQVITIIAELANEMDVSKLVEAAAITPTPWIQRLGYMLELVEANTIAEAIKVIVKKRAREYTMLVPGGRDKTGQRVPAWKLIVNAQLEPDI